MKKEKKFLVVRQNKSQNTRKSSYLTWYLGLIRRKLCLLELSKKINGKSTQVKPTVWIILLNPVLIFKVSNKIDDGESIRNWKLGIKSQLKMMEMVLVTRRIPTAQAQPQKRTPGTQLRTSAQDKQSSTSLMVTTWCSTQNNTRQTHAATTRRVPMA